MGTFAVFKPNSPFFCPYCGIRHDSIQYSGVGMHQFNVGDVCKLFKKETVIKQQYYCLNSGCEINMFNIFGFNPPTFLYIVIRDWQFKGIVSNLEHAKLLGDFEDGEYYFYD